MKTIDNFNRMLPKTGLLVKEGTMTILNAKIPLDFYLIFGYNMLDGELNMTAERATRRKRVKPISPLDFYLFFGIVKDRE